jgi:hypothetical protein
VQSLSKLEPGSVSLAPDADGADATRNLIIKAVVHSADVSAQTMLPEYSDPWGARCIAEFHAQAQTEGREGLPVAPFMQGLENHVAVAKVQKGFCGFVLLPLWNHMARLFPKDLSHCVVNLELNMACYDDIVLRAGEEK